MPHPDSPIEVGQIPERTFAEIIAVANESRSKGVRNPGQWTPAAVEAWRRVDEKMVRMLEVAFALELKIGRKVTAGDEDKVRAMLTEMEAATAALKTGNRR